MVKRLFSSVLAFFLAVGVLLSVPTTAVRADTPDTATQLRQMVEAAIDAVQPSVDISSLGITSDDTSTISAVMKDVYYNDPQFFYYTDYHASGSGSGSVVTMSQISFIYTDTQANILQQKQKFSAAVDAAMAAIPQGVSDAEKVLAAHDYLGYTVTYDSSLSGTITAYHALVNRLAVCEGYSMAFMYLMHLCGIPCQYVISDSMDHGWDLVQINGNWYHVDCTWDAGLKSNGSGIYGRVTHGYLLLSDAAINSNRRPFGTHNAWRSSGSTPLPAATDTSYDNLSWYTDSVSSEMIYNPDTKLWYYIYENSNTQCYLYSYDFQTGQKTMIKALGNWFYSYTQGNVNYSTQLDGSTYLAEYGGQLYYNTSTGIYCINFDGSGNTVVSIDNAPTLPDEITGMKIDGDTLQYQITTHGSVKPTAYSTTLVPVTGVTLNKTSATLMVGDTAMLTAAVAPTNATNKNVSWTSSNTAIATVDANGKVSAAAPGTATITVTTQDSGKTASCKVTVTHPNDPVYNPQYIKTYEKDKSLPQYNISFSAVIPTPDNGYVAVGTKGNTGIIVRYNADGDILWEQDNSDVLVFCGAAATIDGGYAAVGYDMNSAIIVKYDADGNVLWKQWPSLDDLYSGLSAVKATADGGCVVLGSSGIYKYDANGNIVWQNTDINGRYNNYWMGGFCYIPDGGYIAVGYSYSSDYSSRDALIVKLDANGKIVWNKSLQKLDNNWESFTKVITTADGGYIAVGNSEKYSGGVDAIIVKYDANGNVVWKGDYGNTPTSVYCDSAISFNSVIVTMDGGCIAVGNSNASDIGGQSKYDVDAIMVKFDAKGNIVWQQNTGGPYDDCFIDITQTIDEGYIAVGYTGNDNASNYDGIYGSAYIAKFVLSQPALSVTHNDNDANAAYVGNWSSYSDSTSGFYNSDEHFSATTGDSMSFAFTGTSVSYIGATSNNLGKCDVYLDGVLAQTGVDAYSAALEPQQVLFHKDWLSNGVHVITIVVTGDKNSSSSGCAVTVDAFEVNATAQTARVNDDSANITYTGSWTHYPVSGFYAGDEHFSNTAGNSVEYTFTGTGISYIGAMSNNLGLCDVYIDGNLVKAGVTAYATSLKPQQILLRVDGLSAGQHTIKIVVTGTKYLIATDCYVTLDAFVVTSPLG